MEDTITAWASMHPKIRGVVLGGSRAKGNAHEGSDWDFGVLLDGPPSVELVETLTGDLEFEAERKANIAPQLERSFIIVSKAFRTDQGEVSLNFTDANELLSSFGYGDYTIIEHHLEFLSSARIIYDPNGLIDDVRSRPFPDWAREKLVADALGLAEWNIDKYRKARSSVTQSLLKSAALWFCAKAIAAHNDTLLTYRYGYDAFKERSVSSEAFEAPDGFFDVLEESAEREGISEVEQLYTQIKKLIGT